MQPIDENSNDKQHQYTMIFLHGLGDTAEGMMELFTENGWNPGWVPESCRIVLPTAPLKQVNLNDGMKMNSWFNVYRTLRKKGARSTNLGRIRKNYNQEELKEAAEQLNELILEEQKKLPDQDASRIFIGGFSQGCMVSLATLLSH